MSHQPLRIRRCHCLCVTEKRARPGPPCRLLRGSDWRTGWALMPAHQALLLWGLTEQSHVVPNSAWSPTAGNPGSCVGRGSRSRVGLGKGPRLLPVQAPLGAWTPIPPRLESARSGLAVTPRPGPQNPGGGAGWRSPPPCSGPRSLHGFSRRTPSVLGSWSIPGGPGSPNHPGPLGASYSQVLGALGSLQDSLRGLKTTPPFSALWLVRRGQLGVGVGLPAGGEGGST